MIEASSCTSLSMALSTKQLASSRLLKLKRIPKEIAAPESRRKLSVDVNMYLVYPSTSHSVAHPTQPAEERDLHFVRR